MTTPFTLLGDPDAMACEGDSCLVPGAALATEGAAVPPEAASARAIVAALDEGDSL